MDRIKAGSVEQEASSEAQLRYRGADRIRDLARRVGKLGVSNRLCDPETITFEKISIERELRRIARELERVA